MNLVDACIIARQEPYDAIKSCEALCDNVRWFRTQSPLTDYSEARNKSLEMSDAKWVLWIDSDEVLYLQRSGTEIREILKNTACEIFRVPIWNWTNDQMTSCSVAGSLRLMLREKVTFVRYIQEKPVGFDPKKMGEMSCLHIEHMGYSSHEKIQKKEKARAELYRLQMQETPDDADLWYFYAKNRGCVEDWSTTITAARRSLLLLEKIGVDVARTHYVELYLMLGVAYAKLDDLASAEQWALTGKKLAPDYFDLDHLLAILYTRKSEESDRKHQLGAALWRAEISLRPYEVTSGEKPIDAVMQNRGDPVGRADLHG